MDRFEQLKFITNQLMAQGNLDIVDSDFSPELVAQYDRNIQSQMQSIQNGAASGLHSK
jgi:hypothetical protein